VLASITAAFAMLAAALLTALGPAGAGTPLTASAIRDASYGLSVTKTVDQRFQGAGGEVTYRIAVANQGSTVVRGATVVDDVPGTVTGVHWTCAAEGGATCAVGAGAGGRIAVSTVLPPRSRVTLVVQGTVAEGAAGGTIVNRASVEVPSRAMIAGGVTLTSEPATTVVPVRVLDSPDARGPTPSARTRGGAGGTRS
jgi:uncharacterized repeat protein (TIGR01451 family)